MFFFVRFSLPGPRLTDGDTALGRSSCHADALPPPSALRERPMRAAASRADLPSYTSPK
jgi:hypothetical protein